MKKNRLLYIFVLVLACAFVYLYSGKVVYMALYSVILVPIFSFLITYFLKSKIIITQTIDSDLIMKGQEIHYRVEIENKSRLTFTGVRVVFADKKFGLIADEVHDQYANLEPQKSLNKDFQVTFQYRGNYEIGIQFIEIKDFLGLFRFRCVVKDKLSAMVYPRIVEINSFPLSQNLLARSQSNLDIQEEDYTTVSDIRKYQPTDSYKKIHWKLTAKKNELIVKNYQATAANGIALLLDLCNHGKVKRDAVEVEDKTVETAISLVNYCLKRRIQVEYVYSYSDLMKTTASSISEFNNLYALAAAAVFQDGLPIDGLLREYLNQQDDFTNVVILTSSVDHVLYDSILHAQGFGHNVVLLYFADCAYDPEVASILSDLKDMGLSCFRINLDDDITDIL